MGVTESDELTKKDNLQSFSSPYSPQFFINKNDFKGQSIKQVMKEYLDTDIENQNNQKYNKENKKINNISETKDISDILRPKSQKDIFKVINYSIPSLSTIDEEIKNTKNNCNSISISTKNEIKKKEKESIINKIIIEDDYSNTQTTIFTITSSLQKDINNLYIFKEVIGKGSFGIVRTGYRAKEIPPHKIYAIKSIDKTKLTQKDIDNLEKEIDIISSLDHPNIARFYETFNDDRYFHIVTELCRGKELSKLLKQNGGKIKEKNCRIIIMKILHAINYCHSHGVVHCDLKSDNIIFETPNEEENEDENILSLLDLKLIDFGLSSRIKKNEKLNNTVGTPSFIAPETLKGEYDEKCDVWSIGVILYYILSGKFPFNGNSNLEIFEKINKDEPIFQKNIFNDISQNAIDFIKRCLVKNPNDRPSANECLSHPWLEPIFKHIHSDGFLKDNLILNFSSYHKSPQLKKLILKYLVSNMGHTELGPYKSAFYAFDFKNQGIVSKKDIKKIFNLYNFDITDDQIKNIMSICDDPSKSFLTYSEFICCCINIGDYLTPEKLVNTFLFFDMDNNLLIDSNDLKNTLLRYGRDVINQKDIEKILLEATKEEDNKININQFINMYKEEIDVEEYINCIVDILQNNKNCEFLNNSITI
jgi:calcium-dependent protein kinase